MTPFLVPWDLQALPEPWTWRDPRKHPIEDLEGPLGRTIQVSNADDLREACYFVLLHTFLEASPVERPEAEWESDGIWITTHPSDDASTVEVRSRLLGSFDTEMARVAGRDASEHWQDDHFTIFEDALGAYASATVSASPLVLANLAAVLLDAFEATGDFRRNLESAGWQPTFASAHVDFEYFWCGTSTVAETGKYADISENPIARWGYQDE